jgi:hypothetical protein
MEIRRYPAKPTGRRRLAAQPNSAALTFGSPKDVFDFAPHRIEQRNRLLGSEKSAPDGQ